MTEATPITITSTVILERAREIIADPDKFCTGQFAQDAQGQYAVTDGPEACKWCSKGAVLRESRLAGVATWPAEEFLDNAAIELFGEEIAKRYPQRYDRQDIGATVVNDTLGREAALKVFDRAIELSREAISVWSQSIADRKEATAA